MFEKAVNWLDGYLAINPWYDLIVYHKGECVFRHFSGYTDPNKQNAVTGKERVNLYSCSKPITVTLGMMLVERGIISLEDRLDKYIPEYANVLVKTKDGLKKAEKPILLHHLFTMTSGIPYDLECGSVKELFNKTNGECPTTQVARALANEPLWFEPGDSYLYGMSHDILAAVMEIATGKKYEDLAKELIFQPLKMENTTFLPNEADFESMCEHYEYDSQKKCAVLRDKNAPFRLGTLHASGGAGCVSTAEDYIKFGEALRKCELVSQDTLKLMTTNQLNDNQWDAYGVKPYGYGLGMRCPKTVDDGILDFGWDGAASSYFAILPQLEATFFVAQHITNSPKQEMRHGITQYIVEELKKL